MEAVGELYGASFDAVIRRPGVALVPLVADLLLLGLAALAFALPLGLEAFVPLSRRATTLPFSVPTALPTVGDVLAAPPVLGLHARGLEALLLYALVTLPLLAYAEGGFLGVLNRRYLPREDNGDDEAPPLHDLFHAEARRHFAPLLALRALLTGVTLLALALPGMHPWFRNTALGALAIHFVLMYAPYIVVREGTGPVEALRASFTAVSDYLATSLVTLLFLLLTTGGVSALLVPVARVAGPLTPLVGILLHAPIGAALSLFVLQVYAAMRPAEPLPGAAPAPGHDPTRAADGA